MHRQLVSSLRHNRYLGQSEEDIHLICENIIHSCGKHLLYILKIEEQVLHTSPQNKGIITNGVLYGH